MAFKMTPGMKGSPTSNSIMGGGCGGANQPPCPPRFSAEKDIVQRVSDRKISDRSARKAAKKVVAAPAPAPTPVKLQINLPKGYEFETKLQEKMFYDMFTQGIDKGKYKTQEDLDMAITTLLKRGDSVKPIEGPVLSPGPSKPVTEFPSEGMKPVDSGEASFKAKSVVAK